MEGYVKSIHAQRSPEWYAERLGKFTSSELHKLFGKGRRPMTSNELALRLKGDIRKTVDEYFGTGAHTYIFDKLNELLSGEIEDKAFGAALDWGIANEPDAALRYQAIKKVKLLDVGFVTYNSFFGGSPDGLVGEENILENGIVEFKCPYNGSNHLKYFDIETPAQFKERHEEYYIQVQGNMLAANRGWCDFMSFDPRQRQPAFQQYLLRIPRDNTLITEAIERIDKGSDILVEKMDRMTKIAFKFYEAMEAA